MTKTAHVDTFARDHLPPKPQWPEFRFDLPELALNVRVLRHGGQVVLAHDRRTMRLRAGAASQALHQAALLPQRKLVDSSFDRFQRGGHRSVRLRGPVKPALPLL